MKYKNIILGDGLIADVVGKVLTEDYKKYDRGQWEGTGLLPECDILHITIPYSQDFIDIVDTAIMRFQPEIVIVHSTVMPFTTEKLSIKDKLYSPVLGRHNDGFVKSVKQYIKYVAGNENLARFIEKSFNLVISYWGTNMAELEYSKVMCTSRMYWDLVFNKVLERDCQKHDFSFDKINDQWNRNYNQGMAKLNPDFVRPIYKKMETDIPGGHCLSPNIHLVDNAVTRYLKAYEEGILYTVTKGKK